VAIGSGRKVSLSVIGRQVDSGRRELLERRYFFVSHFSLPGETGQARIDAPEFERCIAWNDPDLAIRLPLDVAP